MEREKYLEGSDLLYSILDNEYDLVRNFMIRGEDPNQLLDYRYEFLSPVTKKMKMISTSKRPIEVAIERKLYGMVRMLCDFGASVNDMLFDAIRTDDHELVKLVIELGAKVEYVDHVGKCAFDVARYQKNFSMLKMLKESGLSPAKHGGKAMRSSASAGMLDFVMFFVENGVDIDYRNPDQVFPYASTALIEAARANHFHVVKWLIENGADISLTDKYGDRPYTCAVSTKNHEMIQYIKQLEPSQLHQISDRIEQFKKYKLPKKLINLLTSDDRIVEVKECKYLSYLEFNHLLDCKEVEWNGSLFLDLLADADQYCENGFLVWHPKSKKLANADYEHSEFKLLDTWSGFLKKPSETINKIFE